MEGKMQISIKELIEISGLQSIHLNDPFFKNRLESPIPRFGRVEYVFKPETSYPTRVYVFMNAEQWLVRNRRNSGCANIKPFYSRPMNREELIFHHFDKRLTCYQYENWDHFIGQEKKEANVWNQEKQGFGDTYLTELMSFEKKYRSLFLGKNPLKKEEEITVHNIQLKLF